MSPRTQAQYEGIREEKRNLIMNVALEHFAAEGYHNTTINHIARHAAISKGLLYNYFESKEELLAAIVNRSMNEIAKYFDPDRDGYLTEDEFELFVRKIFNIIMEKRTFWRLFYQLLMQKDVRDMFLKSYQGPADSAMVIYSGINEPFLTFFNKVMTDYFTRKKDRKPFDYDPVVDLNMFLYTMEGFAMVTAYLEGVEVANYEKIINRIIELYK
jgi:AcrR family transcriptional regulator